MSKDLGVAAAPPGHQPSASAAPASSQSGVPNAMLREMLDVLQNFPSDGKPPAGSEATLKLILFGLIERREVEKPCRTCGKPQVDYSYFRITGAGRLFMDAASGIEAAAADETRSGSAVGESPTGEAGDAQSLPENPS